MRVVKELDAVDIAFASRGIRRMVIIERDDGFYTYAEQYYYVSEYDGEIISRGWATVPYDGIYESSEVAEAEGRSAFRNQHGVAY